ncbi:MAG: DUF2776 family protein [Bilophila sp.]
MNPVISILFRVIPLAMGAVCLAYGAYIWAMGSESTSYIAGHVVTFLSLICIALFSTAATIIRQINHTDSPFLRFWLPMLGYGAAAVGIVAGLAYFAEGTAEEFVVGHVVFGLGLIACCVATVAFASTKFMLIPLNSRAVPEMRPENAFPAGICALLLLIPVVCTLLAWLWGYTALYDVADAAHYVAGHVLVGIGFVCASLIALVASVVHQIQNTYTETERRFWPLFVAAMGSCNLLWGLYVLSNPSPDAVAPGFVLIGLGFVCYSILSKVLLLALVWRQNCPLANRIPLIPVFTALFCLFLAAFLFEAAGVNPAFFVPARVLVGLGGVCFTLFSIVSLLESGTSR